MKMKKLMIWMVVVGISLASAAIAWAGGADNKTNWSAEYIGMLNRNAAKDAADIVMYNPAGTAFMEEGFYANLSGHWVEKEYNNNINDVEYMDDRYNIVPGAFLAYVTDFWSIYLGGSNVLGGGKVEFNQGNATTNLVGFNIIRTANAGLAAAGAPAAFFYNTISSQNLSGEQIGPGGNLGAAVKVLPQLSLSAAVRYVYTKRKLEGSITVSPANLLPGGVNAPLTANVDFEEDADGWGGVFGLHFAPTKELDIALRYDMQVDLEFDQEVEQDTLGILPSLGVSQGGKRTRNLPAIFAGGISYQFTPKFRTEVDFTVYLNDSADFDDIPGTPRDESAVDNGYDVGIGFAYDFLDILTGTAGYLYTNTGVEAKDMTPELPELNAHTIGAGLMWEAVPKLNLTFSLGHVFYESDSFVSQVTGATIEYEKDITFIGFGLQYRF
jgi:long-chain fatty acid transport protein